MVLQKISFGVVLQKISFGILFQKCHLVFYLKNVIWYFITKISFDILKEKYHFITKKNIIRYLKFKNVIKLLSGILEIINVIF
jgi:hypothetical protein